MGQAMNPADTYQKLETIQSMLIEQDNKINETLALLETYLINLETTLGELDNNG